MKTDRDGFVVVCPTAPGRLDGIADYAGWLAAHLAVRAPATLVGLPDDRPGVDEDQGDGLFCVPRVTVRVWRDLWRSSDPRLDARVVLLHYVPQLYWGTPGLPWLLLWLVRQRWRGRLVGVTVHEYAVPAESVRRLVARALMISAMVVLGSVASHLFVTFQLPRRRIGRLLFWKRSRIALVPVGSNIRPVEASGRPRRREKVTCVLFGQPAGMSAPLVAALATWVRGANDRVEVRWIARSSGDVRRFLARLATDDLGSLEVLERLPAAAVSQTLASADLFLAPIVDGVSTRRTTIVAALAHGLPIVGTDGVGTDGTLRNSGACALVAPSDRGGFVSLVEALVADPRRREEMGRAARALYESAFTWEHIAEAYVAHLGVP